MKRKTVSFLVNETDMRVLQEVTFLEPFLQDNIRKAKQEKDQKRILFDADDLFDAISAVEYYAEGCSIRERRAYEELLDKMKRYLNLVREPGQQLGI